MGRTLSSSCFPGVLLPTGSGAGGPPLSMFHGHTVPCLQRDVQLAPRPRARRRAESLRTEFCACPSIFGCWLHPNHSQDGSCLCPSQAVWDWRGQGLVPCAGEVF